MPIIALANQKGGVAKTTSTHNIGVSLAKLGKKTLIIDLDSQASLTIITGLEPYHYEHSIVTAMQRAGEPIKNCINELQDNLHIVTSRIELAQQEMEMLSRASREMILGRALEPVKNDYDYILIDCPPQLSILTINGLSCADYVIIPVKTDYLAYRGLEQLQATIKEVQDFINPRLVVMGVIATIFDKRLKDDKEILQELESKYNVIGVIKNMAIAKRGVYSGKSVMEQAPDNDIANEYNKISSYIIEKGGI